MVKHTFYFVYWGILFCSLPIWSQAQTCTGQVLNISALTHSRQGTTGNWTVLAGGPYKVRVTAKGARGGDATLGTAGAGGATIIGDFILTTGQVIEAVAGAPGKNGGGNLLADAGGGGGSGVRIGGGSNLIVAGGGGGGAGEDLVPQGGQTSTGNGQGGGSLFGAGGGGWLSAGSDGFTNGNGNAPTGGGAGFNAMGGIGRTNSLGSIGGDGGGGFGGGGGGNVAQTGGGGGGGYSGGVGGRTPSAGPVPTGGGSSYNIGANQNNTASANNAGGQVIIECLGAAVFTANFTATQPVCANPAQGSLSIDLMGDLNGYTSGGVEYAIVSGGTFSGNPAFADITADPFNITSGTGTLATTGGETYTVRVRLKYNHALSIDYTYTLIDRSGTIYVKSNATGANNGTSWANAFTDLQSALAVTCEGAQIWVAAGTYKPVNCATCTNANRTTYFVMKNGVQMLGGFPNNNNSAGLGDRNWSANPTILSGDIGAVNDNADNTVHVVTGAGINATAILDGFTIAKGNFSGLGVEGAGLYLGDNSSPTIVNCIFSEHSAIYGGAVYVRNNCSPSFTNCVFQSNMANWGSACLTEAASTTTFKNCTFFGNTANSGVINSQNSGSATVQNCILWGNTGGSIVGNSTVSYSIVQGGYAGTGNLNTDPLFVNAAGGNLRLQACSPAIDAGSDADNSTALDLGGNARKFEAIAGGQMIDMGAYEYQQTAPAIMALCKNITVSLSPTSATVSAADINNGSNTNCGATLSINGQASVTYTCSDIGPRSATLSVYSAQSNRTSTCQATVNVVDMTPPTVVCQNMSVNLNGSGTASITPSQVFNAALSTDNCGTANVQSASPNSFTCSNLGQNTVTLTANDGRGNNATCQATVTVVDNAPPTVTCQNITVNLNGSGTASLSPAQVLNTALSTDNCGTVSAQSVSPNSFTCSNLGQNTVTLTANDGVGLTANCTATVTVRDVTPPTIACPANIIRANDANQCGAAVTYAQPVATDNCGSAGLDHLGGGLSGSTFPVGNTTVTWMATDGSGLTATCSFTVTVTDSQAPNIACPANQAVGTDAGQCYATVSFAAPIGSDNCNLPSNAVTQTTGPVSSSAFQKGATTVAFKVTDAAGLTKTCSFRVIVSDAQNPTIVCPGAVSVPAAAEQCSAVVTYATPTATDNCTPAPTVVRIGGTASGSTVAVGNSVVIWRAIDGAGRSSTCSIGITVTDSQAPTLSCPGNIMQANPANACNAPVFYPTPTVADNCGVNALFMVEGMASGSSFPIGTTSVVWRAVDNNGLSATCSFSVTVSCGTYRPLGDVVQRSPALHTSAPNGVRRCVLSPNPAAETVDIVWDGAAPEHVAVFDAQGRLVWEQGAKIEGKSLTLDVSGWIAGVYMVVWRANGMTVTKRLIVSPIPDRRF